jgi:hypothetical protein
MTKKYTSSVVGSGRMMILRACVGHGFDSIAGSGRMTVLQPGDGAGQRCRRHRNGVGCTASWDQGG